MFSIIAIGLAAIAAIKTYNRMSVADPVGTHTRVESVFQGAEMLRTIAAFVTSLLNVLKGNFRPVGQMPIRQGGLSSFTRVASDAD